MKSILTRSEFVSEGLWSKTFNRARTDEIRKEDLSPFFVFMKDIEWVDMGHGKYLFSKYDFPLDLHGVPTREIYGKELLSINEIIQIKENIPEDMKIMNSSIFGWLKKKCDFKPMFLRDCGKPSVVVSSNLTSNEIYLNNFLMNPTIYLLDIKKEYPEEESKLLKIIQPTTTSIKTWGRPKDLFVSSDTFEQKNYNIKLIKLK